MRRMFPSDGAATKARAGIAGNQNELGARSSNAIDICSHGPALVPSTMPVPAASHESSERQCPHRPSYPVPSGPTAIAAVSGQALISLWMIDRFLSDLKCDHSIRLQWSSSADPKNR